jgi:hypothetical protein
LQFVHRTEARAPAPALAPAPAKRFYWHLEFICDDTPYLWHGMAASRDNAIAWALTDLEDDHPFFKATGARCVAAAYSAVVWPCSCSCAGEGH